MYICNVFPQFRTLAGGERLSLRILEEVVKAGHRVEFVTLSMDKTCLSIFPKNIKLIQISSWMNKIKNHYLKVFIEHIFIYRAAKFIPQEADIVIFHKSSSIPALYTLKKIMKKNIPAVYFSFEPPRFAYDLQKETLSQLGPLGFLVWLFLPIFRFLDQKFATAGNEIITYSIFMKNWLESIYNTKIKNLVPLGVNPGDFDDLNPDFVRKKYRISEQEKIIITSNKLHHRKRVGLLIEAMEHVKYEFPQAKALIMGTGPEEMRLKKLVKKLSLVDKIIFCGHIGNEIPHYYASADIYVHPGKNEPFGLSVIEAQMAGVPVVSVREGEPLRTVVDGKTGIFCDAQPEDMADKIIMLLKNEKFRKKLGGNTQEHIKKNYTWQISARRFIGICESYASSKI